MSKIDAMLQVGRTFGMRDGMLRLQYELQRGSGLLSWRMRSVQGWDSWDLRKIAPGVQVERMRTARRNGACRFFFDDVQALGTNIREMIGPEGEKSVLAEAEGILQGKFPFFGQLRFATGFPPGWFRNPVTGQAVSPQQSWTQMRFASPVYGDLKFILEPSRFLFVYPLVRAYALSGDDRIPQAFWSAIEDWASQSPPMGGPLWICGQECSLRMFAWSFALHAFIDSPSTTDDRVALLVSMIAAHAWRTAQTIGYARSQRSNHLISEAVGLWTTGTLYPELAEAQAWQNLGAHLLHDAVIDHITPEGVSQQHSFNYQRMVLHLLLWTLRLGEIYSAPLHEDICRRAQSAFDFIRQWVDPVSGLAPNYGSDDGSLIFPLSSASYRDLRPLVQLGAAVLNRPGLNCGPWDEAALWFGVKPAPIVEPAPIATIQTGYFRLGDQTSWAMIRAGRYTRRPFQADQLHVDLWWRGMNLARDPGTYLYNGSASWNNGFAGTAVHNTVTVDGQDQMRRVGRFLWVDWAQASGRAHASKNDAYADRFEGEHDGYRRFGVAHRRAVQWLDGSGWVIVDDISDEVEAAEHDVCLRWLAADLPFEVADSPFQVAFKSESAQIRWSIVASVPGSAAIVRAGKSIAINGMSIVENTEERLLGWEASTYGELRPAVSLVQRARSRLPIRFVTVVLTDERCTFELRESEAVIVRDKLHDKSAKLPEYRVSLSAKSVRSSETDSFPVREFNV
ncbi:MAG: alginate lyase family protein [Candidatus Sulfotelmatobacter sp.]